MSEFLLPSLGADMKAAALVSWQVKPGDAVKRGDVLAEIETDKGVIELEVFEDGVVEQLLLEPGEERIPVGTPIAVFRGAGEPAKTAPPAPPKTNPEPQPVKAHNGQEREAPHPADQRPLVAPERRSGGGRVQASPSARKLARELGVDLKSVQGTGPHGAIQRADVARAAKARGTSATAAPPEPEASQAPSAAPKGEAAARGTGAFQARMRQAIAAAMSRANRDIPHYYLEAQIDLTETLRWLEAQNAQRAVKDRILPAALLLKATALALAEVPDLNGFWIDERHEPQEAIHVGFAISLRQGGLIAPAIHHTDQLSLDELMGAMRDLITRTRAGRLRSSELTEATVTLTSLGDLGTEKVYGVIYPPQVALVGFGKISERPWVEQGLIGARRAVTATLAADHRASDGARGSQFLEALKRRLKEPSQL